MNRASTSPYRGGTGSRGATSNVGQPLEVMVRTLQRQNNSLVEQIKALRVRTQKVGQLEDKIDLVLKHNTQLLNENQRLAKLINQKKSETELWKNKYDSLVTNKSASSQLEIKRLLNQIEKLKEQICEVEHAKNIQINELKNQNHLDIQNIKRTNLSSAQKYELEIRKLKEYCDKKEYQISELNMKYVRLNKQTDFQINKLRQEKERLKSDLLYEQNEHKREVDTLKSKFDFNFHSQIENLKKQHLNQMEALDYENSKLKEVIGGKNQQIQQILSKNSKVKGNYEDSLTLLQRENDDLKDKLIETERINQLQISNLRDKLQGIKQSQVAMMKAGHSHQTEVLNREIKKMNDIIDQRNFQIENLAKQRNQMRLTAEAQVLKARTELQTQINQNKDAILRNQQQINQWRHSLDDKNAELKTIQSYYKAELQNVLFEKDKIASLYESKAQQLSRQRTAASIEKKEADSELSNLREKLTTLQQDFERFTRRSNNELGDIKKNHELKSKQYQTRIKSLDEENVQKDRVIKQLKLNIANLESELKKAEQKVERLENCQKDLRRQARQDLTRWDTKERQYNILIKDQIASSERTKNRQVQQLRHLYENKLSSSKHQIRQNEKQIEAKNKIINDLKQRYEDLVNKFQEVFGQRAAQKNLDIKVPGWLPETLATKSLFDVFIKNKVLDYCS